MVTQMRQATTKLQLVECRDKAHGNLEGYQLGATMGEATRFLFRSAGRGSVLAHACPRGGQRLAVKGGRVGGRPGAALYCQPLAAYASSMSQHTSLPRRNNTPLPASLDHHRPARHPAQ
jgi:hypothetical protein